MYKVIMKVSEKDYVPAGVTVRMQISPYFFTAMVEDGLIEIVKKDPKVAAVSPAVKNLPAFNGLDNKNIEL